MASKSTGKRRKATPRLKAATDSRASASSRVEILLQSADQLCASENRFSAVLRILTTPDEPVAVRLAALRAIQAASFVATEFRPYRAKYIKALRALSSDEAPELREWSLGILARAKDRPTQTRLLQGIDDPAKALVPPEKALQLLSYDVHAGAGPAARKILAEPPNEMAKVEALRVLAADATAVPLLADLLRDRSETEEVRQICAAALQNMVPTEFQKHAREMLLDEAETDPIRSLSLTALTTFGDAAALRQDKQLQTRIEALHAKSSGPIKKGSRAFLSKYAE